LVDNEFHCAHAVFQRLRPRKIVDQELLDATAGFIGGTLFTGMTCSAFTAGVMAVGVMIGEIENSRLRVLHMIAKMAAGGDAFDDDINKFNRVMNIGNRMARWFTDVFGSTQCRAITQCDFSTKSGVAKYIEVECVARCKTIAATVAETVEKVGKEGTAREGRDVDQGQGLSVR
jgi:hypothetical protein